MSACERPEYQYRGPSGQGATICAYATWSSAIGMLKTSPVVNRALLQLKDRLLPRRIAAGTLRGAGWRDLRSDFPYWSGRRTAE
jgi:hypothetical protein